MLGKQLLLLWFGIAIPSIQASIILSDNFSYRDGPLVDVSGAMWKTHSGTAGQVRVISGKALLSEKKSEDVSAAFPGGPISVTNAAFLYTRFTATFSALPAGSNGAYFAHFKDATATMGLRCRIFATTNGAGTGCFRLGISAGSNTVTALLADDLVLDSAFTVVCRMALADNTSTIWLNPRTETDPSATSTDSITPKTAVAFAFRESLAASGGIGELSVDDLVIATTFDEVISATTEPPELMIAICVEPNVGIRISWPASAGHTYSVWGSELVSESFWPIVSDLSFPGGTGLFEAPTGGQTCFFRVSSP
jgi:hypothetical protein